MKQDSHLISTHIRDHRTKFVCPDHLVLCDLYIPVLGHEYFPPNSFQLLLDAMGKGYFPLSKTARLAPDPTQPRIQ